LALVLRFTVKERIRGYYDSEKAKNIPTPSFTDSVKFLLSKKTFVFLAFATGLHAFVGYANTSWMPPLLERIHELDRTTIGLALGGSIGIGGGLGTFLGGYISDKLAKKDNRWYLWISAYSILFSIPLGYIVLFTSNMPLLFGVFFFSNILFGMYLGPSIAVSHSLVPAHMRSMASAVLFFILNIIGIGLGPLFAGILSDLFEPSLGVESVRYALAITVIADLIALYLFYKGAQTLKEDLLDNSEPEIAA